MLRQQLRTVEACLDTSNMPRQRLRTAKACRERYKCDTSRFGLRIKLDPSSIRVSFNYRMIISVPGAMDRIVYLIVALLRYAVLEVQSVNILDGLIVNLRMENSKLNLQLRLRLKASK